MIAALGEKTLKQKMNEWKELTEEERKKQDQIFERKKNEDIKKHHEEVIMKAAKRGYTSLQETDWGVTFDSIEITPQNEKPILRLRKWNPNLTKGAVLFGNVGTGKSTLCKALINCWASPEFRCLFISVADAMQRLKNGIDNKDTTVAFEEEQLISPNLLILDDLGAEKMSDWAREKLFVIFERRASQKKFTFFTTNLESDQIKNIYKDRIHDRMIEFCSWIKLDGDSFRKKNFENEI